MGPPQFSKLLPTGDIAVSSFCSCESKSSQAVLLLASVAQQQSSKRISAKAVKALVPTLKRLIVF